MSGPDDPASQLSTIFPSPPAHYAAHAPALRPLLAHLPPTLPPGAAAQNDFLRAGGYLTDADEDVPFDLREALQPPRVDWIVEDGGYDVYGERWPIPEVLPGLEEMGMQQLYPKDVTDRRPALHSLLRTLLHTHLSLTRTLLEPPPPLSEDPFAQVQEKVNHIQKAAINMHHLLNELRPVQARETLLHLERAQLDRRRRETREMRETCARLRGVLSALKEEEQSAARARELAQEEEGRKAEEERAQEKEEREREESAGEVLMGLVDAVR